MLVTSALIPPLAVAHWLRGWWRSRAEGPGRAVDVYDSPRATGPAWTATGRSGLFDAVLLDRDGTLVEDVPYNGDPEQVRPVPGARAALDRLRAAGLRLGVVTNQSGLARGLFTEPQTGRGATPGSRSCSGRSTPGRCARTMTSDGCGCRKPAPGSGARRRRRRWARRRRGAWWSATSAGTWPRRGGGRRRRHPGADAGDPAGGGRRRAGGGRATCRRGGPDPAPAAAGRRRRGAGVGRGDGAGGARRTRPATCWSPGRRSGRSRPAPTGWCCCAGRAGGPPRSCCPGVDEIVERRLPWIDPHARTRSTRRTSRALTARLAAVGADEAVDLHLVPPVGAAAGAAAADGRRAADQPRSATTTRARCSTCATGYPSASRRPERALSLAAAAGFTLPAGDDPRCGCGRRRAGRPADRRCRTGLRGGAPRRVGAGAGLPAGALRADRRRAGRRRAPGGGHRRTRRAGPDRAGGRRRRAWTWAAGPRWPSWPRSLAGAGCRGRRQHRAGAPGRRGRHAGGQPLRPDRPVRTVGPVPGADASASATPPRPAGDTRATDCPVPGHPACTGVDPGEVVDAVRLSTASA